LTQTSVDEGIADGRRTPLYDLHVEAEAQFTAFAGWQMPLRYADGTLREHLHTRAHAGLFDISHMGQIALRGKRRAAALEALTPADVIDLPPGRQRYALLTNHDGGIIDDIVIANMGEELVLVVNAARTATVLPYLHEELGHACEIRHLDDLALLAVQGPAASATVATLAADLPVMPFQSVRALDLDDTPCRISRSGYTGEDGYEIAVSASDACDLARRLLAQNGVQWIGLGARDSLRLEAGLCLYGHDIDERTTPLAAGLGWTWPAVRRPGGERPGGFPGAEELADELAAGAAMRRVGLLPEGRAPLRENTGLLSEDGNVVGRITSGLFSPSLERPIAMGYLRADCARNDTPLHSMLRGRAIPVARTALPFVPHRYHKKSNKP
jgi:aminomethyltransferase